MEKNSRMKGSYKIATYLIIAAGIIHIALAFFVFDRFAMRVMWFVGVGLMAVFLGFLNIAHWRTTDPLIRKVCILANCASVVFGALSLGVDRDPQGYFLLGLLVYCTIASIFVPRKPEEQEVTQK